MKPAAAFRSGFAAVLGRPNVGKSSLINALVGRKVSIVSPKPQTTRRRVQAVWNSPEAQVVLLDTPGVQRGGDLLGRSLVRAARETLDGIDAVLLLMDAARARGEEDAAALEMLRDSPAPVLLVVNKIDLVPDPGAATAERIAREIGHDGPALAVSALTGYGLDALKTWILGQMGPGPKYFPDGALTDQSEEVLAAELIRERILVELSDEVPHETAVYCEEMARRQNGRLYIRAVVAVERASQKAIVIGAGGARLKEIGRAARLEIERIFGEPVYLEIWVKVVKDWRNSPARLQEFGYESDRET